MRRASHRVVPSLSCEVLRITTYVGVLAPRNPNEARVALYGPIPEIQISQNKHGTPQQGFYRELLWIDGGVQASGSDCHPQTNKQGRSSSPVYERMVYIGSITLGAGWILREMLLSAQSLFSRQLGIWPTVGSSARMLYTGLAGMHRVAGSMACIEDMRTASACQ